LDLPSDLARPLGRVQAGNEVQSHVDAGRHASCCHHAALIDESVFSSDLDAAAQFTQVVERAPMCGRRHPVEQTSVGEGK